MMNMNISEFLAHLNSLDVQVFIEGGEASLDEIRLRCNAPEGTLTKELRQELAERKEELVCYLHSQQCQTADRSQEMQSIQPSPTIQSTIEGTVFLPSFAQQRLWFLYQLAPNNPFYNVPAAIRFTGKLDRQALERAIQEIVCRHAALRTTFTTLDGKPVQVIADNLKVALAVIDLSGVPGRDRDCLSQQLATTEAQRPFNLTTDPLLRVTLLQFDSSEAVLLLTLHHIIADGWSLGILIKEIAHFYTAFVAGKTALLPPLPIQYTDFAYWQRNWLQGEVLEKQLSYWRSRLQDLPVLNLPSDRPRPAVQTYRGATYPLQLSPTLTRGLADLSQEAEVSLFMVLLAAFQTLLHRYTDQTDIVVGSPIANRQRSELEGLIGFFVNSLVMRADLSGNPTFRQLLGQVRHTALEAYEHQDLPFEKLVEELDPERDLGRNPLFQVAFALQNAPMQPLELPGLRLEPTPLDSGTTRFDLEVHLWEADHGLRSLWQSQEGLSGFISYSTDLFDRERIVRLVEHFQTLLAGIVANPETPLSELPILTELEREQILGEWNQSPLFKGNLLEVPLVRGNLEISMQECCFHHIFEAQVQNDPNAIAIVSEQGNLTYKELNQQANHLGQTLRQMGVQTDSLVGLCLERSAQMVIGILGILKAGGAYVPIDPDYPRERLQFILSDTQVSVLLTQSRLVASLPSCPSNILCLDQLDLPAEETFLDQNRGNETITPDHLAYVIYTSGSTGIPKGVLLSHRSLCNVVEAQQQLLSPSPNSRILQFSSLSFDASIFEIALALGSGSQLYIPPKSAQLPGMALVHFLQDNSITHALLTPAVLAVLPVAELPALQVLITGGEACSSQVVDRWAANRRFFNAYGPTETTIWATIANLHSGDNPLIIGHPLPNTQVYILDTNLNPVPVGIPGELYIGGAGLARGYLNRPELTLESFIDYPERSSLLPLKGSQTEGSKRLYKTGDRARYLNDGRIEFLGRVDTQIKIRGFRVELGEIEARLQHHPAICDAVVIASGETSTEMRLVTYFSLNRQYDQQTVSGLLQSQQIQSWQTLYNQTYQSPIPNPQFNITGWNSSYTGEQIPVEQMQEWVRDRVLTILAFKPQRVLEIGCGTGLLLFQIAPQTQKYVGTDFSTVSLQSVQEQLDSLNLPQVELLQRVATDFEGIDPGAFDLVILNSIVQYFPSVDYLMQVLEEAIETLATGGVLFLGDVRSLPLLTAFHTWVQFSQADGALSRNQLQQRVARSRFEESELAIDPAFFSALRHQFPQIRQVQIRLSRGHAQNEMTQFRYNVLLHIEKSQADSPSIPPEQASPSTQQHNWKLNPITIAEIQKQLIETEPEILIITNVKNSRINLAVRTAHWLENKEVPKTVKQMREILQNSPERSLDPQDWWDLATVLPYNVEITWSTPTHTGDYDVILIRHGIEAMVDFPIEQKIDSSSSHYTNDPLQFQFARQLIPELNQFLRQALPEYMIPSAFIPLEILPLTVNGKVDRCALPISEDLSHRSKTQNPNHFPVPLTPTEANLIEIWKDLLQIQEISPQDNFFELGGHSLLATQMTSRVRDVFELELPLKSVFEAPTIAQLAPIIETLGDTPLVPKLPPLVQLDRATYRHKRSMLPKRSVPIFTNLAQESSSPNAEILVPAQSLTTRSPLVPLTLGGKKEPFFCVHPMFGVVFPYLELAQHLDRDRSFYGLQPLGLDGKSSPLNSIKAIAAHYIQAIQTLQPQGPYFLGGWSFGGLVAFEMAQQLTQVGQEIGLLAIIDTPAPCYKPSLSQSVKFLLGTALWSTLPFVLDYGAIVTDRFQSWNSWFSRWQWSRLSSGTTFGTNRSLIPEESRLRLLDESAISPMLQIFYANAQAAYGYIPQPYHDCLTLFRVDEQTNKQDSTLGWSTLTNKINLHQVPGNHLSLLKQPHVQVLAQQLGEYL